MRGGNGDDHWNDLKMTTSFPRPSLEVAASAAQEPSLLRRCLDAWEEVQHRKARREIVRQLRHTNRDEEFRRELERRLLGQ